MLEVSTEKFSGPLGLLLSLIESEEMDITEISLAKIADEYVRRLQSAPDIDSEEMADFLVVAAKLLYIKSKALLPYLYADEEDEEFNDLERQLKMYREFISASTKIKSLVAADRRLFIPAFSLGHRQRRRQLDLPVFSPPAKVKIPLLHEQFLFLVERLKKYKEAALPESSLEPQIHIEEKISLLKTLLLEKLKVNFSLLLSQATSKTEVIVSFLALLELAKQQEIIFEQSGLFSEIHISRL